jgi:hypothetical protein
VRRRLVALLLCAALAACATHERRCEGRLEPINPPASAADAPQTAPP